MNDRKHIGTLCRRTFAAILAAVVLAGLVPVRAAGGTSPDYIVKYKDPSARLSETGAPAPFDVVSEAEMKRLDRAGLLEWYEEDGDAVLFDPEPQARLFGSISPYYEDDQWNLDMIGAEAAFRQGFLGQGIRVGVLDSGVNPHPDLAGCLLPGHNYIEDAEDPGDTTDNYGHGTRVAGLIAASGETGYIGTAPGTKLVPLKVTDGKRVKVSTICAAVYDAIDNYDCRVLNLSMGVQTDYASLREAMEYAESKNVVVVSSVGNNGSRTLYYPAGYDTVIGVGAVDSNGALYYHSNYNSSVFLTAPGVDVRSPAAPGGYTVSSGTSFAVPQVSGAAAVLLGADGSLTAGRIRALLAETASDSGAEGYDESFGYGVLNLAGCIAALTGREPVADPDPCSFLPAQGPATALRNNTDRDIACTFLLAYYDDTGACLSVSARQLTIPPQGTAAVIPPDGDQPFGQFVFETDTMIPLTAARRSS